MTRREARKSLGSRVHRRAGTKTKVIPGGGGSSAKARLPKFKTHRAKRGSKSNAAKVAERMK
jgi:hypothetical protein